MRKITFAYLSLGVLLGFALLLTCSGHSAQLSPQSRGLLAEVRKARQENKSGKLKLSAEVCQKYLLRETFGGYSVYGIIRVTRPRVQVKLEMLDVQVNSKVNDLWTVSIPVSALEELSRTRGIEYIEIDTAVKMRSN